MNILFWNLKKNSIEKYISQCIKENQIDLAVFSEYDNIDFEKLICLLGSDYNHILGMGGCEKITLVSKKTFTVCINREQDRYVLYTIKKGDYSFILTGLHLQDRINTDALVRITKIGRIVNDIKNLETSFKCNRTVIIGDFNANPYDDELLAMSAFNSVLFKDEILRSGSRTVDGITYRRFYNPILHYISEESKMYGSFYHAQGSSTPIWHCLDQVLVSKSLANNITNMKYIKTISGTNLITRVRPNSKISDHLPLVVTITEE